MSYKHFTLEERESLQEKLSQGLSMRKIAALLGRSPSSISREIRRNCSKSPHKKSNNVYKYNAWRADNLYILRRRQSRLIALKPGTKAWNFVLDGLRKYWSPAAICGRWHREFSDEKAIHASTIYRYIKAKRFEKIEVKTHLRRRGKKKYKRNSNYNSIQPDRTIPQWPDEIRNRSRIGDWEGDTVYGGPGKGYLVTLVDRRSRYLRMGLLQTRNATETRHVIEQLLDGLPVHSISLDNGSEFAEFRQLEDSLHTLVYFAEPHKPWQRGSNENTNDIIRFFFPKGFDFSSLSEPDLQFVEYLINSRPRSLLDFASPLESFPVALT